LATEIERLEQQRFDDAKLLSRADTAEPDLRARKISRDQLKDRIDKAVQQIGPEATGQERLVLMPEAIDELGRAAQNCLDAETHLSNAEGARDRALEARGDEPRRPRDLTRLKAAWDQHSKVADLSVMDIAVRDARRRLGESAAGLPKAWRQFVAKGLPAIETLTDCATEITLRVSEVSSAKETLAKREGEYAQAVEVRKAWEQEPAAIDAGHMEETRSAREAVWHAHRTALDADTADRFEEAMRRDDVVRENFMAGSDARFQLSAARKKEAKAKADHGSAQKKQHELERHVEVLLSRAAQYAKALGLPPDTKPSAFQARLNSLANADKDAVDLERAEKESEEASARRTTAFNKLRAEAEAVGIKAGDVDLAAQVSQALVLQDSVKQTWDAWKARDKSLSDCETEIIEKKLARDEALGILERLTVALPLIDRSPQGVRDALPALREIESCHVQMTDLHERVEAMERAINKLRTVATRIAETLEMPFSAADDPMEIVNTARTRVEATMKAERARIAAEEGMKSETRLRLGAQQEADAAQTDLDEIFFSQGGAHLAARERADRLKRRDNLRGQRAELQRIRNKARAGIEDKLFDDELRRLPDPTRAATLKTAAEDANGARDVARDRWRDAKRKYDEAHATADPAKLIAEQAVLRETLRDGARQAAIRRIGVRVARDALKRLAAERRSSMLNDVRDAFVAITAPAWTSVDAWTHDAGEKLVGTTAHGDRVHVDRMSTGTMGQLYFALRLAGYRSFVREAGPLPMILDDIMETFDNTRAIEALKLCGELGRQGQVIMFTHHEHLVDLAQQSIPGVEIIKMRS
ncbi:MAG: hypothetical protein AAFY42_09455, partial [Pseudomonadota bacterium]